MHLLFGVFVILTLLSCQKDKPEAILSNIIDIQENAITVLNSQGALGHSYETIINYCIQQLMHNPDVETAYLQDSDQIVIKYKTGATGVIFLDEDEDEDEQKKNKSVYSETINPITKGDESNTLITNHKVLIWEAWGDEGYPIANTIEASFNACPNLNFGIAKITGTQCTMQSLRNLTQYGFVYIHTHGGCVKNTQGEVSWILTRERCSPSITKIEELNNSEIIIVSIGKIKKQDFNNQGIIWEFHNNGHYFGVTSVFLSKYLHGTFITPSVVYIQACCSSSNLSLSNLFVNDKKATYYLGFDNPVTKRFGKEVGKEFVDNMLKEKLSAHSAYFALEKLIDPYDTVHKALLVPQSTGDPTYYCSEGYVECPALGKRWELTSMSYSPDPYLGTTHFSQLLFLGNGFHISYRLSKMDEMAQGTYTPYVIDDIVAENLWNIVYQPMHFAAGTYSSENQSTFWHEPDTHTWGMSDGELKYHKNNGINKYEFYFTGKDGHNYSGEFLECK